MNLKGILGFGGKRRDEPKTPPKAEEPKEDAFEQSWLENPEMERKIARIATIHHEHSSTDDNYQDSLNRLQSRGYFLTDRWTATIDNLAIKFETSAYRVHDGISSPEPIIRFRIESGEINGKPIPDSDLRTLWEKWNLPMKIKAARLDAKAKLDTKELAEQTKKRTRESWTAAQNQVREAIQDELDILLK